MRDNLNEMKLNIEKGKYLLLLSVVFVVPISSFISVRLLFITLLISLVNHRWSNLVRVSWDLIVFLLILVIGLTYTINFDIGFKVLETSFSFLAVPIIVFQIKDLNEKKGNQIFYSFILGLTVASFICLLNAVSSFIESEDIEAFFFYQLTDVLNLHPTYLAYYLIFAITFALYELYYRNSFINPVLIVLAIAFFFFMLMLTGGTTSFISLLFVFSFFILKSFLDKNTKTNRLAFALVSTMMILMFTINSMERNGPQSNDSWDRFDLWKSAISANPNFLFGVGTGDYKGVLNEFYLTHGMEKFANQSLNSHNQFIQVYFSNGLLGLVAVLILLVRPLYLSFKNNNSFGVLVFFPFLIYGVTEVFLGRYQGVIFFALLHQVFINRLIIPKLEFDLKSN